MNIPALLLLPLLAQVPLPPKAPPLPQVWYVSIHAMPTGCPPTTVTWTNLNNATYIKAAWDMATGKGCVGTNVMAVTGYLLEYGRTLSTLNSNVVIIGRSNLTATLPLPQPVLKSNRVISITTLLATNIMYSSGHGWTLAGCTNLTFTNPVAPIVLYRAMGRTKAKPAKAFITEVVQ